MEDSWVMLDLEPENINQKIAIHIKSRRSSLDRNGPNIPEKPCPRKIFVMNQRLKIKLFGQD